LTSPLSELEFSVESLMPRLLRLKNSTVWKSNPKDRDNDPGQLPLCRLSEVHWQVLYPESEHWENSRQILFRAFYNHFIFAQYRGKAAQTRGMLRLLVQVRGLETSDCLRKDALPSVGSEEWIPADLTDEIRALDGRYDSAQPDTPATYVVADRFWEFLVKATPEDIDRTTALYCTGAVDEQPSLCSQGLTSLVDVARAWNRSPSVVGLCYQVD
jgi:hypothetical protein